MTVDQTRRDFGERERVSTDEDYEVEYFAKRHLNSPEGVRELIRQHGQQSEDVGPRSEKVAAVTMTPNIGPRIKGKLHSNDIADERRHFYTCPACGKPVDMRDLRQVMLHETPGHGLRRRWTSALRKKLKRRP